MYGVGGPTNGNELLGVVGHHLVGMRRLLRLGHWRGNTPRDEGLRVHQVLQVRRPRPRVQVAVTTALAVVGAAVVHHGLQVPPLLRLDLLPRLHWQSDLLRRYSLLLVVLIGLRAEPLQD